MAATKVAVDLLLRSVASLRVVTIHSDSRAAILALSALTVKTKLKNFLAGIFPSLYSYIGLFLYINSIG